MSHWVYPLPIIHVIKGIDTMYPFLEGYGCNSVDSGTTPFKITHTSTPSNAITTPCGNLEYNGFRFWLKPDYFDEYKVKSVILRYRLRFEYQPTDGTNILDAGYEVGGGSSWESDKNLQLSNDRILTACVVRTYEAGCPFTENKGYAASTSTGTAWGNNANVGTKGMVGTPGSQVNQILAPQDPSGTARYMEWRQGLEDSKVFLKKYSSLKRGTSFTIKIPVARLLKRYRGRNNTDPTPWYKTDRTYSSALPSIGIMFITYPMTANKWQKGSLRPHLSLTLKALVTGHHGQVDEIKLMEAGTTIMAPAQAALAHPMHEDP